MAINRITGEAIFNFNNKKYSVRPELGLAAMIEGQQLFPSKSETSVYDLLFMFDSKRPMVTVIGKMLYLVLSYIGENELSEQEVAQKVFDKQGEPDWFDFYGEMYEIVISLCNGGINIKEDEKPSDSEVENKELGKS